MNDSSQKEVEGCWECLSPCPIWSCGIAEPIVLKNCAGSLVIEGLGDLYEPLLYVKSSEDGPEAIVPCPIEGFLEVDGIVEQGPLVLPVFLDEDSTVDDLFHCAASGSKTCLFF